MVRHLAQLTKMQPKGYIKDMKWLGNSLWVYSIKMQYENVFKSDRWCSCYTCLPQSSSAAQTALKVTPGTPPKDQRLLTNTWPKQGNNINIHANKG